MRRNAAVVLFLMIAMVWLAGCRPIEPRAAEPAQAGETTGMANPASVNCVDKGGTVDIRKDASGGEVGYCVFPDGSECEEWAFMRGECKAGQAQPTPEVIGMPNPAAVFCTENGGTEETRTDANGGEYGVCVFANGSECDEWAFFRGDCSPEQPTPEANMVNPASAYCVEQGGESKIVSETAGDVGYCVFPDGSQCEEWAYYRNECEPASATPEANMANPASVYCTENGGTSEIRQETNGEVGYCVFDNGNECEEWAYFRGECAP